MLNKYEKQIQSACDAGIKVHENFDLNGDSVPQNMLMGLYIDGNIALDKKLDTTSKKACVLAEEIGHYYTASGNILDMSSVINRKQEHLGRMWAYNKLIGLIGIIDAFEHGCQSKFEIAEYLDVTEDFLSEAISAYRAKYGVYKIIDNYVIYFIPNLSVVKFLG